ncbi:MAG: hypothetical protein HUU50_11375 [Candidatus Brocadiae bacterium]|nr:hypothetical protein [Candidatus Brocadiia bacterium]
MRKTGIKKLYILICFVSLFFFSGCWVKVSEDNTIIQETEAKQKVLTPQKEAFFNFKAACEQQDWKKAYGMLSSRWQQDRSMESFTNNMKQVGHEHLKGARIDTIVQSVFHGKQIWAITTINLQKDRTMYVFVEEKGTWKIDGVKNLP